MSAGSVSSCNVSIVNLTPVNGALISCTIMERKSALAAYGPVPPATGEFSPAVTWSWYRKTRPIPQLVSTGHRNIPSELFFGCLTGAFGQMKNLPTHAQREHKTKNTPTTAAPPPTLKITRCKARSAELTSFWLTPTTKRFSQGSLPVPEAKKSTYNFCHPGQDFEYEPILLPPGFCRTSRPERNLPADFQKNLLPGDQQKKWRLAPVPRESDSTKLLSTSIPVRTTPTTSSP